MKSEKKLDQTFLVRLCSGEKFTTEKNALHFFAKLGTVKWGNLELWGNLECARSS